MEEKKELKKQDERVVEIELERLRGFPRAPVFHNPVRASQESDQYLMKTAD